MKNLNKADKVNTEDVAMKRYDTDYEKIPRKYSMNHHFFDAGFESPSQFYWAGFLAATANVVQTSGNCKAYRIELNVAHRDTHHLKKMMQTLQSNVPVRERSVILRGQPYKEARTVISSKYMVQDLQRFNITARKKRIYAMPQWLTQHKWIRHFIRGWVDGTGNFYGKDKREFRTGGTVKFVEQLKEILQNHLFLSEPDRSPTPSGISMSKIKFVDSKDVIKIAHFLYDDAKDFMERKRNAAFGISDIDTDDEKD